MKREVKPNEKKASANYVGHTCERRSILRMACRSIGETGSGAEGGSFAFLMSEWRMNVTLIKQLSNRRFFTEESIKLHFKTGPFVPFFKEYMCQESYVD